jgi:2-polyprenyl-3-methyl-5-hydroxy-6-metoxy-1,4-benzoquinol methylase
MQLAWAFAPPIMIGTAVQNTLFDLLADGPKSVDDVAKARGLSPRGVRALLNALVGIELLTRDSTGRYALTPESATFLVTTSPRFHGGIFRHADSTLIPNWLKLSEVVRTGKPVERLHGSESDTAEFFERFVEDIFPLSYPAAQALARHLRLAETQRPLRALDIGAGSGVWGVGLAQASPRVLVTAVDYEKVLGVARRVAQRHGVADRFTFLPGDIRTVDFGTGYDIVTIGHILHGEGEADSRKLLRRCHAAMSPGGTMAIAEFVPNDNRTGPPNALIFAVNMLVNTPTGDTFTFPEIAVWLKEAGFVEPSKLEAPGPSPLILARKG